jgi:hypothetical protein
MMIGDVVSVDPWLDALITGCSFWSEASTDAVKVADWAPPGTKSKLGTCTRELVDWRLTMAPVSGAACASWTVQSRVPALFGSGTQENEEMALQADTSEIVAVCVLPFSVAVMVAV